MDRAAARGAVLIVAGMAIIGLIDNFIRFIAVEVGLFQFHALRSMMAIPVLLALGLFGVLRLRLVRPGRVAVRTGLMAMSMMIYFGALPVLPIAQVAAGLFTAPIFVLIYTAVLLRRRVGPRRMLAVAAGFLGVMVMLRPEAAGFGPLNLLPVLAGAIYGASTLVTREWCAEEPVGGMLLAFFAGLGALALAGMAWVALAAPAGEGFLMRPPAWPSAWVWALIAVQAYGSLLAVAMLIRGYQLGDTSVLTVFEYSFLVFSGAWGWVIWGEALGPRDGLGMALILAAGLLIVWSGRAQGSVRAPVGAPGPEV